MISPFGGRRGRDGRDFFRRRRDIDFFFKVPFNKFPFGKTPFKFPFGKVPFGKFPIRF